MKKFILLFVAFHSILSLARSQDSLSVVNQVDSLIKISRGQLDEMKLPEAVATINEAKLLAEQQFGKSHPSYIESCNTEVNVHWRMGNYPLALEVNEEALSLQLTAFGKENTEYAALLHLRGTLHLEMGNYGPGEQDFLECLVLREKVIGKKSVPYAMTLNNLGNLYHSSGQIDKSKSAHLDALKIRQEVLGEESFDYAMSMTNLGRLSLVTGEYEKSIEYLSKSKALTEKIKSKRHPLVAFSTHNLAIAYIQVGMYDKAEDTFKEALELVAASLGEGHPQYSFVLSDMGMLYYNLRLPEKARDCYQRSIEIKEKTIGREHNYTLVSLGNLATLLHEEGSYEEAAAIYQELNAVYAKNFGHDHPENLITLSNLANLYIEIGEPVKGDSLHRATLAIRQDKLAPDHPSCALNYSGISAAFRKMENPQDAWLAQQEAHRIFTKAHGPGNFYIAKSHLNLAEIAWEMGQPQLVLEQAGIYANSIRQHLLQSSKHLSANELQLQMPEHIAGMGVIQSARFQFGQGHINQLGGAYDDALFFKGMLLENSIALENNMSTAPDSIRQTYLDWKALQRRLAEIYAQPLIDQPEKTELENRTEALEKTLVRNVAFRNNTELISWQQVQSNLVPTEAAIEFIHFNWKNPEPTDSTLYAALVLKPGQAAPSFIPLFEEKSLDRLVNSHATRRSDYVNDLYALEKRGTDNLETSQKSLYEMIWQPLEKELEGVEKIYYSPSGLLHRLNLGAIPVDRKTTLADQYELTQLGSTRQLVFENKKEELTGDALLFGGIQYEADTSAMLAANASILDDELAARSHEASTRGALDFNVTDTLLRGGTWRYLNGTDVEVAVIQMIMKHAKMPAEVKKGFMATEEAFKSIGKYKPSPKVLHLATHGYFFPDPEGVRSEKGERVRSEPVFKMSEHPMIRSGLILAGGNHAWKEGQPLLPGMEDGILTAYEISQMDLSNTELVVLSACETGLGDIQGNEGVYGLQRAFKIAGAKYLIMSLWQVPDFQTQELMTAFYEKCLPAGQAGLEGKMSIPDAFRAAQKEMREKYQNPYSWAGFVLVE